jgi:hypothetical protein
MLQALWVVTHADRLSVVDTREPSEDDVEQDSSKIRPWVSEQSFTVPNQVTGNLAVSIINQIIGALRKQEIIIN